MQLMLFLVVLVIMFAVLLSVLEVTNSMQIGFQVMENFSEMLSIDGRLYEKYFFQLSFGTTATTIVSIWIND